MKWLLKFFIPFEDAPEPEPEPEPKSIDPESRPDWCPEKFWDVDMKAPRTEIGFKAFGELETKLRENKDVIKTEVLAEMKASAPEEYKFEMPEGLDVPENIEFDLSKDDPMVNWFHGFAKENGLSQDIVDGAIKEYIKIELAGMPDITAEIGKLGDHGMDRLQRVHTWIESKLTKEEAASLHPLLSSATQVEALEKLMLSSGPGDFEGENQPAGLTLDELRAMQADPRYLGGQDKAFIKKVTDGYDRLYKGNI